VELDNLTVKIYTQSGKGLGFFDDENWEDTIEIIKEHLENGNSCRNGEECRRYRHPLESGSESIYGTNRG